LYGIRSSAAAGQGHASRHRGAHQGGGAGRARKAWRIGTALGERGTRGRFLWRSGHFAVGRGSSRGLRGEASACTDGEQSSKPGANAPSRLRESPRRGRTSDLGLREAIAKRRSSRGNKAQTSRESEPGVGGRRSAIGPRVSDFSGPARSWPAFRVRSGGRPEGPALGATGLHPRFR
jgi:hypothetical protein